MPRHTHIMSCQNRNRPKTSDLRRVLASLYTVGFPLHSRVEMVAAGLLTGAGKQSMVIYRGHWVDNMSHLPKVGGAGDAEQEARKVDHPVRHQVP
jgi:hypothetical protein